MADTDVKSCAECGASIYQEHVDANKAGVWNGQLVCVHCFQAHQSAQITIDPNDFASMVPGTAVAEPASQTTEEEPDTTVIAPQTEEVVEAPSDLTQDNPIRLAPMKPAESQASKFTAFQNNLNANKTNAEHKYRRHPHQDGRGAIRCRIFHAKLNDGAISFLEGQINDWIDQSPQVEIKHVNTEVGVFEGKSSEPHLIVSLFY